LPCAAATISNNRSLVISDSLETPIEIPMNSELFDEGFCKTFSELDADGNEIGSFKLERIEIGHIAKALDSGEFSEEKEFILQLFYDFMKKMNIEFIEDVPNANNFG